MSIHDFVSDYTGAFPDRLKQLLLANTTGTASTWTINDLWMKFFTERGFTSGSLDDRMRQWLLDYTGATVGANADLWALITEPFSEGALPTDLLDLYPSAVWAYSVSRRLRSDYAGSLFRVRRSSDNAEQDIGFDSGTGLVDTSALTTFVGANNGFVVTQYNQAVGGGTDITQATASAQPVIVSAGVLQTLGTNSRLTAVYDGNKHLTSTANLSTTDEVTILTAASRDTDTGGSDFLVSFGNVGADNGTFNLAAPSSANGDLLWRTRGSVSQVGIGPTIGTAPFPVVVLADSDISSDSRRIRANAGAFTTAASDLGSGNFSASQTLRLGGGSASPSFIGKISEFVVWPNDNQAGTTDLDSNLMTFYGIA